MGHLLKFGMNETPYLVRTCTCDYLGLRKSRIGRKERDITEPGRKPDICKRPHKPHFSDKAVLHILRKIHPVLVVKGCMDCPQLLIAGIPFGRKTSSVGRSESGCYIC